MKKRIIAFLLIAFLAVGCGSKDSTSNSNINDPITIGEKKADEKATKVSLTIDNRMLSKKENFDKVKPEFQKYVNKDGYIIKDLAIEVYGDLSVLEILEAVGKEKNIPIVLSDMGGMKYVSAINHLEGGLMGDMSGWLYSVNNTEATVGASEMKVKDNDKIVWAFSLDGGKDIKELK